VEGTVKMNESINVKFDPAQLTLLTMCSSKNRPSRLKEMLDSFHATRSAGTEILVYVSEDDPGLNEYKKYLGEYNHIIGPNRSMSEVLNHICTELYPDVKYYSELNDDHICRTKEWDRLMINAIEKAGGWGITYGQTRHLPTAIMVSGNIIRTLGYIFYPELKHLYIDNYIEDLGKGIGKLIYVPEVNIEHMHAHFGMARHDDTYERVYSNEQNIIGLKAYENWKRNKKDEDIIKLMNVMNPDIARRTVILNKAPQL